MATPNDHDKQCLCKCEFPSPRCDHRQAAEEITAEIERVGGFKYVVRDHTQDWQEIIARHCVGAAMKWQPIDE
jgi:hypothetical protein